MTEKTSLDDSLANFARLLQKGSDIIIDRYRTLDTAPAWAGHSVGEIQSWFDEALPQAGMDPDALLEEVKTHVIDSATLNIGPHFYAYVNTGGTQIAIIAEMLAAAINQNTGKWHLAPAICEIEKRLMRWSAELIGYSPDAGGVLQSGGSAANLAGLTVARNIFFEKQHIRERGLFGLQPFTVYASSETHGCIDKSIELLGIGMDHLRKIPVSSDSKIDLSLLQQAIARDKAAGFTPFCVIGNAGTVNAGGIDPLVELADIAREEAMWFHVDGAYGGLAAGLDELKPLYKGLELADSLAVDFHKWLYQPFEAGCVLVKGWDELRRSYYKTASYLSTDSSSEGRLDFNDYNFQLSRNAKALKIWMTFKAYGSDRIKAAMRNDIALSVYLEQQIRQADDFELCSPSSLGICCFRYRGNGDRSDDAASLEALNLALIPALEADGRIFITGTQLQGRTVLRACQINHRKQQQHIDFLLKVIREVGTDLQQRLGNQTTTE